MNLTSARLMGGELRYGNYGFYCSNGRKHVFHHLFSESSGTSMDIGPCEGDSCPFAQTHGLHNCRAHESCLDSRRITLDSGRDLKVYFHPRGWQGRGKNRRRACSVTIMRAGSLEPGWYHELAREAEAADGLTANRPHDWLECKRTRECGTNEKGHHWSFEDDAGTAIKHPDGRYVCKASRVPMVTPALSAAEARRKALTPAQHRSPLGRRPTTCAAAVSLWLNSGVPATEVARRAGHGVAIMVKIHATASTGRPMPPTGASPTPSAPRTPSKTLVRRRRRQRAGILK